MMALQLNDPLALTIIALFFRAARIAPRWPATVPVSSARRILAERFDSAGGDMLGKTGQTFRLALQPIARRSGVMVSLSVS